MKGIWMTKKTNIGKAEIYTGDCVEVLQTLPDNSVDAVISDPPYGINYEGYDWDSDIPPQFILDECLRISRGPVIWFGAASMIYEYARYEQKPQRTLIWHVTFSNGSASANGIYYNWHPIICWQLPKKAQSLPRDVINLPTERGDWWCHRATKPLKLMKMLVNAFVPQGGSVLDPYLGSGTTCVAAEVLKRESVGIELNPEYVSIATKRIEDIYANDLFEKERKPVDIDIFEEAV